MKQYYALIFSTTNKNINNFSNSIIHNFQNKFLFIKIKLINNCNLHCQMCNHWQQSNEPLLSIDFYKTVVDELALLGCKRIHFTGGEPLLYPKLEKLIKYIKNKGIKATLTSNATLIDNEKAVSLVKSGLKKINISIDSPIAEIHDKIRGNKGYWEKAVDGLSNIRPYVKHLDLNVVINSINYKSLVTLPDFAMQLGVNNINLIPIYEHTPDIGCLTVEQIQEYNKNIAPIMLQKALEYNLVENESEIFIFGTTTKEVEESSLGNYSHGYYKTNNCYVPWTHSTIDFSGNVKICCKINEPILGNLKKESFTDIWNGITYNKLRTNENMPISKQCKGCLMFAKSNLKINEMLNK